MGGLRLVGHPSWEMAQYPQSHVKLDSEDRRQLEAARDWVKGHFAEHADAKYEPLDGKLRVIDAVLQNDWVEPTETWKLQALGIALGDALAQKLLLEWVVVDDEYGRSPALIWPGTSICSFPQTMIAKRVERGERVDIHQLFEGVCAELRDMAYSGRPV